MNEKQIKQTINDLKSQMKKRYPGKSEETIECMILDMLFKAFCDDKIDRADLTALTNALGYVPKDDILDQVEKEKQKKKC